MNLTRLQPVVIEITGVPSLDPVRVILIDLGPNEGRLIVECYGQAWAAYWPAMGSDLATFIRRIDVSYLAMNLERGRPGSHLQQAYLHSIAKAVQEALQLPIPAIPHPPSPQ